MKPRRLRHAHHLVVGAPRDVMCEVKAERKKGFLKLSQGASHLQRSPRLSRLNVQPNRLSLKNVFPRQYLHSI